MSILSASLVFVIVFFVRSSMQCSCDWGYTRVEGEDVPNILCYNNTYVYVTVLAKERISDDFSGEMRFDVTLKAMYPKDGNKKAGLTIPSNVSLYAPISNTMCGYIDFQVGQDYVVSVYEESGKYNFNGCSYGKQVDEISEIEQKLVLGKLSCVPTYGNLAPNLVYN